MHIFLTGEIQIGKSTIIRKVLSAFPRIKVGGYCTITREDIPDAKGSVYIIMPDEENAQFGEHNRAGIRYNHGKGRKAFAEVFDNYGVECLSRSENSDIIIMDEIGVMEREADLFSEKIISLLDNSKHVFGVLRKSADTPLAKTIRSHSNVCIVEVNENNRESLVPMLIKTIGQELGMDINSDGEK